MNSSPSPAKSSAPVSSLSTLSPGHLAGCDRMRLEEILQLCADYEREIEEEQRATRAARILHTNGDNRVAKGDDSVMTRSAFNEDKMSDETVSRETYVDDNDCSTTFTSTHLVQVSSTLPRAVKPKPMSEEDARMQSPHLVLSSALDIDRMKRRREQMLLEQEKRLQRQREIEEEKCPQSSLKVDFPSSLRLQAMGHISPTNTTLVVAEEEQGIAEEEDAKMQQPLSPSYPLTPNR